MSMRARWRSFELPTRIHVEELENDKGVFIAEPFEEGYGTTVGNSLRRVLQDSLEGTAVTSIKLDGVVHEFASIEGVLEDVTFIVLNVKGLCFRMEGEQPRRLTVDVEREGPVTGADIDCPTGVECVNPDHVIATLTEKVPFKMELVVEKGRGYRTAADNVNGDQEIGIIPVDSFFSPVKRVEYKVENTRVGQLTNYDRLIMRVETDGTKDPETALVEASKILRKHLNPFIFYFELGKELAQEEEMEEVRREEEERLGELRRKLNLPIAELDLSVRASNCLEAENIQTIADLVRRSEAEMLKVRNFGKTSLKEINKKLAEFDLKLGMELDEVLPEE